MEFESGKRAGLFSREELHSHQKVQDILERYIMYLKKKMQQTERELFLLRGWFNDQKRDYDQDFEQNCPNAGECI